MKNLKVNDRVKRAFKRSLASETSDSSVHVDPLWNLPASHGTVKAVKEETSISSNEKLEDTLMIQVCWDNGTLSYLGADSLELVE